MLRLRGEHDHELVGSIAPRDGRLRCDLRGELGGREAEAGKDRQLLAHRLGNKILKFVVFGGVARLARARRNLRRVGARFFNTVLGIGDFHALLFLLLL